MSQQHRINVEPTAVLFSCAFRPFFLLVGAYAIVMMLGWGLFLGGLLPYPDPSSARIRHGHEMVFGFAGGAIAGFLLTAVATWTGRRPVGGQALIILCAIWLLARLGGILPGPAGWTLWTVASLLFWAALLGLMAREVIAVRNIRNYKVLVLLSAFLATETVFFLTASGDAGMQDACLRTGLFLVLGMISLIGGRIIPAFTQNWLRLQRPEVRVQLPAFDRWDFGAVLITALVAAGIVLWPESSLTGVLALVAGLMQAVRVARWRGWLAWREPLLWVLHIGYAWIPVGFTLLGFEILGNSGLLVRGIHALGYGAVGTLILGVAARVALGHTGRPLQSFPAMSVAFGLMSLGTLSRIFAEFGSGLLWLSVSLWVVAYGLFLFTYAPILLLPRLNSGH